MAKIRDLGINSIPAAVRLPEDGAEGAKEIWAQCPQTIPTVCPPSCGGSGGKPKGGPKGNSDDKKRGGGSKPYGYTLSADAVAQLRQQLNERTDNEFAS